MIHGVFFDLDGTLFDTKPDILAAYGNVFQDLGVVFEPGKLKIGPPLTESLRQLKPDITPEELHQAVEGFRDFYDHSAFPGTNLYPGIREMLDALKNSGRQLFVATNKRIAPTMKILELKGVLPYFTDIYGCDSDPAAPRTKTGYLQLAMEKYHLAPENCIMVGDTRLDVEAGRGAGLRTAGVTWGYDENGALAAARPAWILSRAEELVQLVENL